MAHRDAITTEAIEVNDETIGAYSRSVSLSPLIDVDGTDQIVVGGVTGHWLQLELGESDAREAYRRLGEIIGAWDEQDEACKRAEVPALLSEMAMASDQILLDADLPLLVGYARKLGYLDTSVELYPIGNRAGDFLLGATIGGVRRMSPLLGSRYLIDKRRGGAEGIWHALRTIRHELRTMEEE